MACELGLVVTGASGSRLAGRFAELAAEHDDVSPLHVVLSDAARLAVADELGRERATSQGFVNGLALSSAAREDVRTWAEADLGAPRHLEPLDTAVFSANGALAPPMFALYLLGMIARA